MADGAGGGWSLEGRPTVPAGGRSGRPADGGGQRARLMAGGAVAGSGLAAAGREGRSGGEGGGRRGLALWSPSGRQQAGDGGLVAAAARRVLPPGLLALAIYFVICNFVKCEPGVLNPKRPVGLCRVPQLGTP